jgi:hypothetical protein
MGGWLFASIFEGTLRYGWMKKDEKTRYSTQLTGASGVSGF